MAPKIDDLLKTPTQITRLKVEEPELRKANRDQIESKGDDQKSISQPGFKRRLLSVMSWARGSKDPHHSRRINWTCECGDTMYWDVKNVSKDHANALAAYLDRANSTSASSSSSQSHESSTSSSSSSSSEWPARNATTPPSGPSEEEGDLSIAVMDGPTENSHAPRTVLPRFIELCINTGEYEQRVGEVNITDTKSDGEVFEAIASTYRKERLGRGLIKLCMPQSVRRLFGSTSFEWSLMKPSEIVFCKFLVDEDSIIGVCNPELPPPPEIEHKRYEYTPCPLQPCEVMPAHIFFHIFHNSRPHYNSKWVHRLPKKLRQSIFSSTEQIPVGWGIHIVEKLNMSVAMFLGLAVSGVFAVVCASMTRDIQGAFGVAAAVQMAWMSVMFFKWSQE